ncbi:uncharacterized protein LOC135334711 [Halichondria panicea]|uniref:uncharacterized protein LOC135334711 n=1 Tax=Halichondria panicea TaxID=6063 RepID=UPI00312BA14C
MADLATLKRRRGTVKASLTRLTTKLAELEDSDRDASFSTYAQQYVKKLETLDASFKTHHLAIMDIEKEEQLGAEQEALDQHDEDIMTLSVRLQVLLSSTATLTVTPPETRYLPDRAVLERRSTQLQARLLAISEDVSRLSGDPSELHLVFLHQEQLSDLKKELSDLRNEVLVITTDTSDVLWVDTQRQDRSIFDASVKVKKLLHSPPSDPTETLTPEPHGVKLPKIDVPTFDGDMLHWKTFWEQFDIAIDGRSDISNTEKLVYLRHSLKDCTAKSVIEGLSHTGDQYAEATASLKSRYDRPRIIHQAHVRKIYEVANLKEGSGKELRQLHDTVQQHLRALKAMGHEPSGPFITSLLELKLDKETMFEWQRASQDSSDIPHYSKILNFLDLRGQASETCSTDAKKHPRFDQKKFNARTVTSHTSSATDATPKCPHCKTQRHPVYVCPQFKSLPHDKMLAVVHTNSLCLNCLRPGHIVRNCVSNNRCRKCQKSHHTLLHNEAKTPPDGETSAFAVAPMVSSNAQPVSSGKALLMTCQVLLHSPDGSQVRARGLIDSGSSTSFISEHLAQSLCLPRSTQNIRISGIAGISHGSPLHSIASFKISPVLSPKEQLQVSAIVVPRVTCDLPIQPIHFDSKWKHLSNLQLADPDFGQPNKIDILLGVDVYADVVLQGRRSGPVGTPVAFETKFGWVLAGRVNKLTIPSEITSHHVIAISGDDILRKFWELEEGPRDCSNFSPEERFVVQHYANTHTKTNTGRFVVPLPKNPQAKPLGESRSSAIRRFLSLERSLHARNQFQEFASVMQEYVDMNHAELVPETNLKKPSEKVFYLPMHAVRKEDSTTTKLRVVFDASAKSSTGVSLNDTLLVGPTVHPPLIDVLLRFRTHRVALTTDVSKMYRAIDLTMDDRDMHRFVWRNDPNDPLCDYRMTRVTFGVSASSFAANMSVKQNAIDHATNYPLAANAVNYSFYVDDGLTGADSVSEAIELQRQLQDLFSLGGFLLRKWTSSEPCVIKDLPAELKDSKSTQTMPSSEEYTKTLGIQWNAHKDHFKLAIASPPPLESITKRGLLSDVAKTFDVLGWFSPSTIKVKILMQLLWECKIDWDDPVPSDIQDAWIQWRKELPLLSQKHVPRCYFDKKSQPHCLQLHGFSDASEVAYAAVVYLRITDKSENAQISLVMSKTKVAPIKRLTIPRLELCGAQLLAQLIHHVRQVLEIPLSHVFAWTDSTIVLNWLDGSPKRFKTYVGNRVSTIVDLIPPDKWRHVAGTENPADCASRGLYPSELLNHSLWWDGPIWLKESSSSWPEKFPLPSNKKEIEESEVALSALTLIPTPIIPVDRFSGYSHLKRITEWMIRFVTNFQTKNHAERSKGNLSISELQAAENYWVKLIQTTHFGADIVSLQRKHALSASSPLLPLQPFIDSSNILRVGGRRQLSQTSYQSQHQTILHGKHLLTHMIIRDEHLRLLHAGPTLLEASLSRRYHIVGGRKLIRSIARKCLTCRRYTARPKPQMLGQLPVERITPGSVFDNVGVDYAGPVLIKYGYVRKPKLVKAYICVFVSLSVKAVHLELVTDLTSEAFIACFKRFIARRGLPSLVWSDNGTNFIGAAREIKELYQFLQTQSTQDEVNHYLSDKGVTWKFIPQRAPHFGGIWEAAVKSTKTHLRRVLGEVKLTYEELSTLLAQIESCLKSRPLASLVNDDDGIEALTPGHFIIGKPLTALPETTPSSRSISLLKRWQLCKSLLRHFWNRWSSEYVTQIGRFTKWRHPTRNIETGDLVLIHENSPIPTKWPLARVVKVHPGKDNLVRVATVRTATGTYTRPVTKLALLLPNDEQ